jgi:adenylate cyclase
MNKASDNPKEIERKFLVVGDAWRRKASGPTHIVQGYLARGRKATIRIRIRDNKAATLTIKSREQGASRSEFEYPIPLKHAQALLELCGPSRIDKQRYVIAQGKLNWEIDVFARPDGLVVAEIELDHETQPVKLPKWIGEEVTSDPHYRNSSLINAD